VQKGLFRFIKLYSVLPTQWYRKIEKILRAFICSALIWTQRSWFRCSRRIWYYTVMFYLPLPLYQAATSGAVCIVLYRRKVYCTHKKRRYTSISIWLPPSLLHAHMMATQGPQTGLVIWIFYSKMMRERVMGWPPARSLVYTQASIGRNIWYQGTIRGPL
jgi:hypothetical protein